MTKNRLDTNRPKNKIKRSVLHLRAKKAKETQKRDFRLRRKRDEAKDPKQRIKRQQKNIPQTLDRKRRWDEVDEEDAEGTGLGLTVDVGSLKRRRLDHEFLDSAEGRGRKTEKEGLTEEKLQTKDKLEADEADVVNDDGEPVPRLTAAQEQEEDASESEFAAFSSDDEGEEVDAETSDAGEDKAAASDPSEDDDDNSNDDLESILDEPSEDDEPPSKDDTDLPTNLPDNASTTSKQPSTTSTYVSLIPDALASKFPTLFQNTPQEPKILITTSLFGTVHHEATILCDLFPNSTYIPRTRHKYKSHHYSLREIAKYASNREFTTILVLNEDHRRPSGLTAIHLPSGPTFHYTITNWVPSKALPGHGRATLHNPELILNNFRTPLGLLTAHFFRSLFPPSPELGGRQVVTLHNQRDYIFVRRHRYVFREKRKTEKQVTDPETGQAVKGVQGVKAGLQELGPRFTLKLRRVDRGVQRVSGQEWEWKGRMEKQRSKFQL